MMKVNGRGVALLELLVAMAVLAVGLVSAASVQLRGTQAFERAWREGQALLLAQGMLERVRAAGQLSRADESQWRAQLQATLGAAAQARLTPLGQVLQVELHWPGAGQAQGLALHGKVLP